MHAFQLRFKESVMFRPHTDVVSAAQASKPGDGVAFHLDTHRGTKGGRARYFPIDNAVRQDAIDCARRVAVGINECVSDPRKMLKPGIRRLRYVMERFGLTRAGLGAVPHGLRHQGAADDCQSMTGERPPVAGGAVVDRELDAQARQCIAERLGHGRPQFVSVYLGSRPAAHGRRESHTHEYRPDQKESDHD